MKPTQSIFVDPNIWLNENHRSAGCPKKIGENRTDPKKKSVFQGTNLPAMLKQARLGFQVEVEALMQKDSADITTEDRELILERCQESREKAIVITHGTDTMTETTQFLGSGGGAEGKTIVLVGSFVPLSQQNSDAMFNLGAAMTAAQTLPSGVWVAMGGQIFAWDKVQKNMKEQIFERI